MKSESRIALIIAIDEKIEKLQVERLKQKDLLRSDIETQLRSMNIDAARAWILDLYWQYRVVCGVIKAAHQSVFGRPLDTCQRRTKGVCPGCKQFCDLIITSWTNYEMGYACFCEACRREEK